MINIGIQDGEKMEQKQFSNFKKKNNNVELWHHPFVSPQKGRGDIKGRRK